MQRYLFGKKPLLDQISIDKSEIKIVYFKKNNKQLINILRKNKINYKITNVNFFIKSNRNTHGGEDVITFLNDTKVISFDKFLLYAKQLKKSIILILDSIQNPHNFGAIIRSAEIFCVDAIICKNNMQVKVNDYVKKTSLGADERINIFYVNNLSNAIRKLKEVGYWIYASAIDNKANFVSNTKFDNKTALIVGNENIGISKLLKDNSDMLVRIKMYGKTQSLNVSVATGIILYEIKKQHSS